MKNALVIDDTKANRIFMSKCLESEGYEVKATGNGKEAMNLLKDERFYLVILDIRMPSVSGMQILKWMRENFITTPVIIVTAYGTVKNAIECIKEGVIEYIQKPFTIDRFRKCVVDTEKNIEAKNKPENDITEKIIYSLREEWSDTEFAPSNRMSDSVILTQAEQIKEQNAFVSLFNMIPHSILILNHERQIIYSNSYFLELLGIKSKEEALGFRPGEILNCIHADEKSSGCGTTECCSVCGAVRAILEAQKYKKAVSKECLITSKKEDSMMSMEFLIYAAPAEIIDNEYTILVIKDISSEKRRQAIEKIFFHDILNTSGSIKGLVECMANTSEIEETKELINCVDETTNIMIDEIKSQIDLTAAEQGELKLSLSDFSLKSIIEKLVNQYKNMADSKIKLMANEAFIIQSDKVLVLRVINNMIKNALEASNEGETITIKIEEKEKHIEICVHNKSYIPREIQLQIFKRSFTTKGQGRGLGTYSMKIIGEDYLKGYVKFTSKEDEGTNFIFGIPHYIE